MARASGGPPSCGAELVAAGCPAQVARRRADEVTAERHGGSELLCLLGNCVAAGQDAVGSLPSGDDRNAGENPSQGRDAGAPGEASER